MTSDHVRPRTVLVTIAATLVAFAIYYPFSPAGRQNRDMAAARQHIPVVRALLDQDPRFTAVELTDWTGPGSLFVGGTVPAETDLARLNQLVESTHPPTGFRLGTQVDPDQIASTMPSPTLSPIPRPDSAAPPLR